MLQSVWNILEQYLSPGDTIIIGVSGGVDSMTLLYILENLGMYKIVIAHFDHQLRWTESDADRLFVSKYAQSKNREYRECIMDIRTWSWKANESIESFARKKRYEFFLSLYREYGATAILTAHHLDDRLETAVFHLLRWTSISGIASLKKIWYFHDHTRVIRPLLGMEKREIREYAELHHIPFREDSSNQSDLYTRNKIRNTIFPKFSEINQHFRRSLSRFVDTSEAYDEWIEELLVAWIQQHSQKQIQKKWEVSEAESVFFLSDFLREKSYFQKELIRYLFKRQHGTTHWLSEALIEEIIRFLAKGNNSHGQKQANNMLIEKRGDFIRIS
jgi:tRNA(Ile)-lysidine synthase